MTTTQTTGIFSEPYSERTYHPFTHTCGCSVEDERGRPVGCRSTIESLDGGGYSVLVQQYRDGSPFGATQCKVRAADMEEADSIVEKKVLAAQRRQRRRYRGEHRCA